jgi:lysyl-tRNA synthetase class II
MDDNMKTMTSDMDDTTTVMAKIGTGATAIGASMSYADLEFWLRIAVSGVTLVVGILAGVAWIYKIKRLRRIEESIAGEEE